MISNISSKHRIIGSSEKLKVVFKLIDKIADAPLNILLTGESGTGKELAARLKLIICMVNIMLPP